MVSPEAGSVVLVKFPFSDLSAARLRPAVVIAASGMGDWILCQVTSNPYSDPKATQIRDEDFAVGSLQRVICARPGRLFTANISLIAQEVGTLKDEIFAEIVAAITKTIQG